MQDKKKRTLEALKKARPNVRIDEFQKWLSENRQRLRSPVYGPVGLELEVVKQEYAKMVEAQTSPHDLLVSRIRFGFNVCVLKFQPNAISLRAGSCHF